MSSNTFAFKQFIIRQDRCAMKVGTDAVLLGAWVKTYGVRRVLDIGTGTGVIALMLAQKSGAEIEAIDIDAEAAEEAAFNVSQSPWKERVHVMHQSLQEFQNSTEHRYELIVSNPPYFVDSLPAGDAPRTAARHAVYLPYEELIRGAAQLLSKEGKFCVILPAKEGIAFQELAGRYGLFITRLTKVKTTPDKPEKRLLMQFSATAKAQVSESTLIIEQDGRHKYTDEYKELTKDYYLNF